MKKVIFALAFAGFATLSSAQIKVDSLSRTSIGQWTHETYEKLCPGVTTIYNANDGCCNLNMYYTTSHLFSNEDAPYFIQCVTGNTNKEDTPVGVFEHPFSRVFYVNCSGVVYARNGMIQEAVNPEKKDYPLLNSARAASDTPSALSRLNGISGVSYQEEVADEGSEDTESPRSRSAAPANTTARLGLVAEEVEAAVPEAVRTLDDGKKGIYYSDLVVVLIDAVNELNAKVQELEAQLGTSASAPAYAPQSNASVETNNADSKSSEFLLQNRPNPFDTETAIDYSLPENAGEAALCVYDLQGKQIKKYELQDNNGTVVLDASELGAGMYLYSLIADGKNIATRRMTITD